MTPLGSGGGGGGAFAAGATGLALPAGGTSPAAFFGAAAATARDPSAGADASSPLRDPQFDDLVTPTFVPVPGSHRVAHSSALSCARIAGMDPGVVARAGAILAQCTAAKRADDRRGRAHPSASTTATMAGGGGLLQFFQPPPPLGAE